MAQEHGDRLTAVDASFLAQEGPTSHMHVGAVTSSRGRAAVRRGPRPHPRPPAPRPALPPEARLPAASRPAGRCGSTTRASTSSTTCATPRCRRRGPRSSCCAGGADPSQQLDRSKPLWETWLVAGLEGGRFALISKTHHALVDGVAGVDLATVLFDLGPVPAELPHEGGRGSRSPSRPRAELVAARRARRGAHRGCRPPARGRGRSRRPGAALARRARRSRASARSPGPG